MITGYTSVARCYQVVPDLGSVTNLSSAQIVEGFIEAAESLIDARLAKIYAVPFNPVPRVIQTICTDITIYRILSQRTFTAQKLKDSVWPDRFKQAEELLEAIANGEVPLVNSGGTVVEELASFAATSTTENYHQTFHEGHPLDHIQDGDKIDDILTDRNLSEPL